MPNKRNLGIWMDHSNAHFIEFDTAPFTLDILQNRKQLSSEKFYEKIGAVIKKYQNVLLFGPSAAKAELSALLKGNQQFENVRVEIKESDKMTQNKQHAFVTAHFSQRRS